MRMYMSEQFRDRQDIGLDELTDILLDSNGLLPNIEVYLRNLRDTRTFGTRKV